MAEITVTGEQEKSFRKKLKELFVQFELRPDEILSGMQELIGGGDWIGEILTKERRSHQDFFGRVFRLDTFRKILLKYGEERIKFWQSLGLEPHWLPKMSFMAGDVYPGWKIKPEQWLFKMQMEGKIFRDVNGKLKKLLTIELEGITVLIDTRLKPVYNDRKQMWENDNLLGDIIEQLRTDGKITKYEHGPQSSRFGVSADEWQKVVRSALAKKLGLKTTQVRLEQTIEMNVIPQLYQYMPRAKDGQTNTWVWLEEYFEGRANRLLGGGSDDGGLAYAYYFSSARHWFGRSLRPLAVL